MIKNIITLKTRKFQNSFYLLIFFFLFSCTNTYYDDKDIIAILNLSIVELKQNDEYLAIEFSPRLGRVSGDEVYLESYMDSYMITQKDIDFMLNNKKHRFKEKKYLLTDYISLKSLETIESNPYYKGDEHFFKNLKYDGFLRLTFPYISIDKKIAIIGYQFVCDDLCGSGGIIIFSKNENREWIISKKHQEWIE